MYVGPVRDAPRHGRESHQGGSTAAKRRGDGKCSDSVVSLEMFFVRVCPRLGRRCLRLGFTVCGGGLQASLGAEFTIRVLCSLHIYILDYLKKRKYDQSAAAFVAEAGVDPSSIGEGPKFGNSQPPRGSGRVNRLPARTIGAF